jgi:hypothetical protein
MSVKVSVYIDGWLLFHELFAKHLFVALFIATEGRSVSNAVQNQSSSDLVVSLEC